jgi:protocatechuate 3,4-dioxygenase beta subunit
VEFDDFFRGRVLSRREALAFLGASGAVLFFGCDSAARSNGGDTSSACVVRPELTEGPYYVDEDLNRSDIRSDPSDGTLRPGALLALTFNVSRASSSGCDPLANAIVDVWHCDALGVYSDVSDPGFNTAGQKFLRGFQVTGSDGVARFTTIYPGWYQGRAVHVHFKVRSSASSGSTYEFTSQLFFDDALTDQVHAIQPYASKGQRDLRNSGDGIYNQGGSQLVLNVTPTSEGYAALFNIALDTA